MHHLISLKMASRLIKLLFLLSPVASQFFKGYEFSSEAEKVLTSPLVKDFSCDNRAYGYYADVSNNCQIFHICWPLFNELEEVIGMNQWSFLCGNQTVFDQATLTCNHLSDALPCEQAARLYNGVDFFKIIS